MWIFLSLLHKLLLSILPLRKPLIMGAYKRSIRTEEAKGKATGALFSKEGEMTK